MPRPTPRTVPAPAAPEESPSTALTIGEDLLGDLLRDQAEQVQTRQPLPSVRIMPAAANLFEFTDTNDTTRDFMGVILGSHPRNVLWERPYGAEAPTDAGENANLPACTAADGKYGTPRQGFRHAALGGSEASGLERVVCATCPYNQWESASMVGRTGRGKACTNQRAIYIVVEGRQTPVELLLPPTSIPAFDEYLSTLFNRRTPTQAVVTHFAQERKSANRNGRTLAWCVATFTTGRALEQVEFDRAVALRREYLSYIAPSNAPPSTTVEAQVVSDDDANADSVPF